MPEKWSRKILVGKISISPKSLVGKILVDKKPKEAHFIFFIEGGESVVAKRGCIRFFEKTKSAISPVLGNLSERDDFLKQKNSLFGEKSRVFEDSLLVFFFF